MLPCNKLAPSDRNLDQDRDLAACRGPLKSRVTFQCHDLPLHVDNVFYGCQAELNLIVKVLSPLLKDTIHQRASIQGAGKSKIALAALGTILTRYSPFKVKRILR